MSLSPSSPSCPTRYPHPPRHLSPIQHPIVLQATEEAEFSKHDGCNPFSWEEEKKEEKCRRGLSICAGLIGWCIGSYLSCISHQIALPMYRQSVSKTLMQANVDDPTPRHKKSFTVDFSTSARQVQKDNHFSQLKQVIEARNRTRGIEFDTIFLTIGVPLHSCLCLEICGLRIWVLVPMYI